MGRYGVKQMIVMRRDLKMRKGKIAAQAGHASMLSLLEALIADERCGDLALDAATGRISLRAQASEAPSALDEWFADGVAKICVYVDGEDALMDVKRKADAAGLRSVVVVDAGATEFHGEPTTTCLGIEPARAERLIGVTDDLPLY